MEFIQLVAMYLESIPLDAALQHIKIIYMYTSPLMDFSLVYTTDITQCVCTLQSKKWYKNTYQIVRTNMYSNY